MEVTEIFGSRNQMGQPRRESQIHAKPVVIIEKFEIIEEEGILNQTPPSAFYFRTPLDQGSVSDG